jgi:hypothetical protein
MSFVETVSGQLIHNRHLDISRIFQALPAIALLAQQDCRQDFCR